MQEESFDMELPQLWKGYSTQLKKHAHQKVQEFSPYHSSPLPWLLWLDWEDHEQAVFFPVNLWTLFTGNECSHRKYHKIFQNYQQIWLILFILYMKSPLNPWISANWNILIYFQLSKGPNFYKISQGLRFEFCFLRLVNWTQSHVFGLYANRILYTFILPL